MQRKRTAAGVTAAALLALAAGCGSVKAPSAGLAASAANVVPWTSRPAPAYIAPKPLPAKAPATNAAPCLTADLKVTEFFQGGPPGVGDYWIKVTNGGRSACIVRGLPRFVSAIEANGTRQPLRISATDYIQLVPSDMRPGGSVYMILSSQLDCGGGASPAYRAIRVGWPAGGSVVVHAAREMVFPCAEAGVTVFGVVAPAPVYPPDPLAALRPRLVLPSSVRTGQHIRYVVELVNPTSRAISLRPCPGYLEAAMGLTVPVKLEFALNCPQAGAVPAGGTVRFAMVLALPPGSAPAAGSSVKIMWLLIGAGPVSASGYVRLVR